MTEDVAGKSCVLVDDTYTSGASALSAASALTLAGANVLAIVPAGRLIDPNWNDESRAYWEARKNEVFDFSVCCLCSA